MITYRLPEQTHKALTTRSIPADQPLDAWPSDAIGDIPDALRTARADIVRELREGSGRLVVDTGLDGLDDAGLCSATWNLFTVLCRPVPQYRTGELIYPVEVSGAPSLASSHYSSSNRTGGFHTDGTLLDVSPHVAMLAGLSTADEGGETVLVDGHALVDRMAYSAPELLDLLRSPHPFHSGDGDQDPVIVHEIVDRSTHRPRIRYLRRYIEQGYARRGGAVDEKLTAALDMWDELIRTPELRTPVMIERGQILLWDNFRFVHGRTPFVERTRHRRLRRAYGVINAL
ncbi:TauD/TfdA family dioxygenase [Streptomyces sp. NPDC001890]|uniref:TauD/TfdA family dioxygenase n=1 Tax=Streptomyces sp. NPDC001890 TaxID=3364620 RepID=UPI0036C2838A